MKPQANSKKEAHEVFAAAPTLQVVPEIPIPEPTENKVLEVGAMRSADEGKPQLKLVKLPEGLQALIDNGIPIRKAIFHDSVIFNCHNATPEFALFSPAWAGYVKANKKASMWFTPHGLICEHQGEFKIVPLANVKECTP